MAEVSEGLSLSKAAQQAGVSETTMRSWAKKIPGTERREDGSYQIPKESLMGFLASKQAKLRGPRPGASFKDVPPQPSPQQNEGLQAKDELLGYLRGELNRAQTRITDLESRNDKLTDQVISMSAQLLLAVPKSEPQQAKDGEEASGFNVIDVEHEHVDVQAKSPEAKKVKSLKAKKKVAAKTKKASKKTGRVKPKVAAKKKSKVRR